MWGEEGGALCFEVIWIVCNINRSQFASLNLKGSFIGGTLASSATEVRVERQRCPKARAERFGKPERRVFGARPGRGGHTFSALARRRSRPPWAVLQPKLWHTALPSLRP